MKHAYICTLSIYVYRYDPTLNRHDIFLLSVPSFVIRAHFTQVMADEFDPLQQAANKSAENIYGEKWTFL